MSRSGRELVRREIRAQWEKFSVSGLTCAFVNSHHHLHAHPYVRREMLHVLPGKFAGWMRGGRICFFDQGFRPAQLALRTAMSFAGPPMHNGSIITVNDTLWGVDRLFSMRVDEIQRAVTGLTEGLHEFIFHPRDVQGDADFEALVAFRKQTENP